MNTGVKSSRSVASKGLAVLALASLVLTGCGANNSNQSAANQSQAANGKIRVVAAENFYGEVAQAVGGDQVQVISLLTNPEQDPHDYEPTPDASKAVSNAQLVVYTGIGYDDWMGELIQANASSGQKSAIAVGSDLLGKASGDNPHVWYDPSTMPKLANQIAADLSKIDSAHAKDYQQRAADYIKSLAPLQDKVAQLKQTAPAAIDVSEPVFGYMADALHLKVNDPEFAKAIEDGNDPAPAKVGVVQDDIKGKKIKMFVDNVQTQSPTVDNMVKLATQNGVPVVKVTETEPTGQNYLQWMTSQLDQVAQALKNQ